MPLQIALRLRSMAGWDPPKQRELVIVATLLPAIERRLVGKISERHRV